VTDKTEKRRLARKRLRHIRELAKQRQLEAQQRAGASIPSNSHPASIEENLAVARAAPSSATEKQKRKQAEIDALERDVTALSEITGPTDANAEEIARIRHEVAELKRDFYAHMGAWARVQLARHPQRPYTEDFIRLLFDNFSEIHGDRNFGDDAALLTGMAWFEGKPVMIIGSQKGRDTKQRVVRNFGQAKPEGYRKALRAMQLAAKYRRPILTFVDTPGAYPGIDAEERGQAEAIAVNLLEMSRLPVPIVTTITGEGGSGGALAVAVADRVFMLENSVYSVISPEGCASIMWRDASKAEVAAEALKITARDLTELKLVDGVVPEPEGGAHADHAATANSLRPFLSEALVELSALPGPELLSRRYEKLRHMGQFFA